MAGMSVVHFTASWVPGEKEKPDAHCGMSGMIQVEDGTPTSEPAHVVLHDYDGKSPCWWPGVTIPAKKQITYGPAFGDDDVVTTDLHAIKIAKGAVFQTKQKDGTVTKYVIEKVEVLAG